ncbi:MAG: 3-dehydroquinate synthase [Thermomicrobiales bacterium]
MKHLRRVVLIGFSGSGKSTVGTLLAARMGWSLIDTDADIAEAFGLSIPEIFASLGEDAFRRSERTALLASLAADHAVVATGGGAVVDETLWTDGLLRDPSTLVIALDARPETVLARMLTQQEREGSAVLRPMLAGDGPLARTASLKQSRQDVYDRASLTLVVDDSTPTQVADEIAALIDADAAVSQPARRLSAVSGSSDIVIAPGVVQHVGRLARSRWPTARRAWIISDTNVGPLHGERVQASLAAAGFAPNLRCVPPGEGSKNWTCAGELRDCLLDGGVERGDMVVALGGGMVGDLAGFVASTALRGIGLVQIPTSLLAMVDSSVGGKTGVNHRTGTNLIGAFFQPPIVVIDPTFLRTLPRRELVSGWAEVIKHAIIQPSTPGGELADLLPLLERNATALTSLSEPATTHVIHRNVALKAAVVEADEREGGIRAFLNFGHTLGHAIEASGYRHLHGEAVAVGIRAAMRIGLALNEVDRSEVARVDSLLDRYGLPARVEADREQVLRTMVSDKKRDAGVQRWILPIGGGGVGVRTGVDPSVVRGALDSVTFDGQKHGAGSTA